MEPILKKRHILRVFPLKYIAKLIPTNGIRNRSLLLISTYRYWAGAMRVSVCPCVCDGNVETQSQNYVVNLNESKYINRSNHDQRQHVPDGMNGEHKLKGKKKKLISLVMWWLMKRTCDMFTASLRLFQSFCAMNHLMNRLNVMLSQSKNTCRRVIQKRKKSNAGSSLVWFKCYDC